MSWNLAPLVPGRHSEGPGTGRAQNGTDRARRVVPGAVPPPVRPSSQYPPLRPLQGLRARFAGTGTSPRAAWLGTGIAPYYPPGIPTPYTHPWYPPGPHHPRPAVPTAGPDVPYSSSRVVVGEPRGGRTQPCLGSQAG